MKEGIHPKYEEAVITCACGNTFTTRSTKKEIHVEVCNKCHPFYTGKQKLVDTGGRVDRFKKRFNLGEGRFQANRPLFCCCLGEKEWNWAKRNES